MAIKHRPKVGEILECNFGVWDENEKFDGHIPPEMRKRRMVVILNGNIDGKSSLVIPISSNESNDPNRKDNTQNEDDILKSVKYHHYLDSSLFHVTDFYDKRERWALCERIATVSNKRLFYIFNKNIKLHQILPREIVTEIQKKTILALNAKVLLKNE
ncbi:type II toxin-antitoxin system PemK/MazF family toxin [Haemophilus haemoglobinophilus]|nr:type II toxin-antitoxin system PemK/MazF family toxin [Canicola haemoglobinophilus]